MMSSGPVVKDLVLVGGGHAHVAVLKRFGMRPMPGVRLTLVTKDVLTPYSGMLPGFVAGHYSLAECHIDLRPLARFAGARLYHDEAVGIDLAGRRIKCADRPDVDYDVVSIDIGSTPSVGAVPGAAAATVPVKPIARFVERWRALVERLTDRGDPLRVALVGAGAGGVELALAIQHRLRSIAGGDRVRFVLVTSSAEVLPSYPRRVRHIFADVLARRGIEVRAGAAVVAVEDRRLRLADGATVEADEILWVTEAAAQPWLARSGLTVDGRGFVRVDETLRSLSHAEVFAAGDIAAIEGHPRPKAGVFAVRAGPPLADNLRRALTGRALRRWRPQRDFLSLISTGDRYAVAARNGLALQGAAVWRLKDWIDRRWMRRYVELPEMAVKTETPELAGGLADAEAIKAISAIAMRCGGCGAKVGATVLSRVMNELAPVRRDDVLIGLDAPDDAAVAAVPAGMAVVSTVDYFRAFIDDAYTFGRIAANHALGDIYAMGAVPQTALAIATIPYGIEAKVEATLRELMAGALATLAEAGTALVGGHTSEGAELALGFAVNGLADPARLLRKGGMRPGDALILTKPIGTGTLFAADMRGRAPGPAVSEALATMVQSNRAGAETLFRFGVTACTDVTGFGLLGHLVEMTRASGVDAEIWLDRVPVLAGARETLAAGITSSLQPENLRLRRAIANPEAANRDPRLPLLFDPQTAGGLLAAVPAEQAETCLAALREAGYRRAAIIGRIEAAGDVPEPIRVRAEPTASPAAARTAATVA